MNEFIKKEDGFTAWRAKLNRLFERLSWLFAGTKEKCVLTSEDGKVEWKPAETAKEQKQAEQNGRLKASSLNVAGIASVESLAVAQAAKFLCRVDADAGIAASAVSVQDAVILKGNGKDVQIWNAADGLHIGTIVAASREVCFPPLVKIGAASIGCANGVLKVYGKASPLSLDLEQGMASFPHGVWTECVRFSNGMIDEEKYTGCAAAADRLSKAVAVFGHPFDGTQDISGCIEGCSGLSLLEDAEISFGSGTLKAVGDVLHWNGTLSPKALLVNAEHYSEWYPSTARLTEGDVVSIDFNADSETYVKVNERDRHPLAVVTGDWNMCIGKKTASSYPCCSKGRVKAKVVGEVFVGARLTVSSTEGALRAMTSKDKPYDQWAVALEASSHEGIKLVKVHIL